MRGYFGLGQLSAAEKSDILDQHKSVYNGYQTMQPQVSNTQPLTVYDFAGDKEGLVVNNKGEVKKYTNMGINEQVETKEVCDDCGAMIMDGMCTECNYGHMEEGMGETCEQCGGTMKEDVCEQCGSGKMEEETGHLDDIYDEEDLNPNAGFDYIEGSSNDVDTFEGMHKKLYKESDMYDTDMDTRTSLERKRDMYDTDMDTRTYLKRQRDKSDVGMDDSDFQDYESSYTEYGVGDPNNEDDGYEDINASEVTDSELDEYDADDMDVSDVTPAYNFDSNGPGDVYPVNEFEDDDIKEYEPMESAFAEDDLEEGDIYGDAEFNEIDVSGVQGIYGAMDRAYDFDSGGPGKGGPYQEFSYESKMDEDEDFDATEDDFKDVDEDLKESFLTQKNKIMEMFNRFNKYN
jgi:hypothetical protein